MADGTITRPIQEFNKLHDEIKRLRSINASLVATLGLALNPLKSGFPIEPNSFIHKEIEQALSQAKEGK